MSTMIAGRVTPCSGCDLSQLIASSAAETCNATITAADTPQRAVSRSSKRLVQGESVRGHQLRPSRPTSATLR